MSEEDQANVESATDNTLSTMPVSMSVNLRGFASEEHARQFGRRVLMYVQAVSKYIDLAALDGITVAFDFDQALLELDRGYETSFQLKRSTQIGYGVAMTPAVMRDGELRSHMLFDANMLLPLEDSSCEQFNEALHLLAHECAHVEVTAKFNTAFPGVLLQSKVPGLSQHCRSDIILGCWNEYAVTRICAGFGRPMTDGYEETFIRTLKEIRPLVKDRINAYRIHANLEQIVTEVYGGSGEIMKFAAYHLGNMTGLGLRVQDVPKTQAALKGHWFASYWLELAEICEALFEQYGEWTDRSMFEALGDLADKINEDLGMYIYDQTPDGGFRVLIP